MLLWFTCVWLQAIDALGNVPSPTVYTALMDAVSCTNFYYAVRVQAADVLTKVCTSILHGFFIHVYVYICMYIHTCAVNVYLYAHMPTCMHLRYACMVCVSVISTNLDILHAITQNFF